MEGIPPARASDNEDVIWALETADSLWKRNARADAIVWLRRAAQEAAEAGDEARASSLMAEAATLTDALARSSAHTRAAQPITSPLPLDAEAEIDSLLAGDDELASSDAEADSDIDALLGGAVDALAADAPAEMAPGQPLPQATTAPRATLAEVVLDVSDDSSAISDDDLLLSLSPPTPVPTGDMSEDIESDSPSEAPPLAADAPERLDPPSAQPGPAAHDLGARDDAAQGDDGPLGPPLVAPLQDGGVTEMGAGALSPMDLAGIPALAQANEEQRERLVAAARVLLCVAGTEVPEFGLALVLEGEVTARVGETGPVIAQLAEGGLLRRRGTFEFAASIRFTVTADDTTVALWTEQGLTEVLADLPGVDAALREQGDRLLAWKCLASSALASRLRQDVRLRLFGRFTPRALAPGAELLGGGQAVPGLFLVGDGSITVEAPVDEVIKAGGFVFLQATFLAGKAPATARAGRQGAIVLFADRRTTQELWATEPTLLELLAGG